MNEATQSIVKPLISRVVLLSITKKAINDRQTIKQRIRTENFQVSEFSSPSLYLTPKIIIRVEQFTKHAWHLKSSVQIGID